MGFFIFYKWSYFLCVYFLSNKIINLINSKLVCDDIDSCLNEAGDIQIPIEEGKFSSKKIYGDIGSIISGKLKGRENDEEITLFKSVGLAIQDISCASFVYESAKKNNLGEEVNFSD